jgi:hypothetical protein
VDLCERREEPLAALLGRGRRARGPGVEAGLRHLQGVAHPGDRPLAEVIGDEAVAQLGGLAK